MNRTGEKGRLPKRKSRFFKIEGYWYYSTREGMDIGPFDSVSAAEKGVCEYIDFVLHAEPSVMQALNRYRDPSQRQSA